MSIESHTITTSPQSATRMNVAYVFTDHLSKTITVRKLVLNSLDTEADALDMYSGIEQSQADNEIVEAVGAAERWENPDKVAEYQSQSDFDRRVLGRLMTYLDAHIFYAGLPFFQAVELRGGANAGQRAAYLGVTTEEYTLVDNRFGDVQGISFFLDDDKNNVWDNIPQDWE